MPMGAIISKFVYTLSLLMCTGDEGCIQCVCAINGIKFCTGIE